MEKLTERQARLMMRGVRKYLAPDLEYSDIRPEFRQPYKMPTITNEDRVGIIDAVTNAFKKDVYTIGELHMCYHLSAEDCRKLVDATVKFLNDEATGSFKEDMVAAGFDIAEVEPLFIGERVTDKDGNTVIPMQTAEGPMEIPQTTKSQGWFESFRSWWRNDDV